MSDTLNCDAGHCASGGGVMSVRVCALVSIWLSLFFLPLKAMGCAGHLYFDPDKMGFFGGTVARMAGLVPPKPVFGLEHVDMAKAVVGQEGEILVQFDRPFFSKNVRLKASSTKNLRVLNAEFPLEDREGSISIPYRVLGEGAATITLTVTGEHKGESVRQLGRIYVRASKAVAEPAQNQAQELQVGER